MYLTQTAIPRPDITRKVARRKYPFDTMKIDEMFFVPDGTTERLSTYASRAGKQLGRTFSLRSLAMRKMKGEWTPCDSDNSKAVNGVGIWRTK